MMRKFFLAVKKNIFWFIVLILTDIFFIIGLWATDYRALARFSVALILFSLILFAVACIYSVHKSNKRDEAFIMLLDSPTKENLDYLKDVTGHTSDESADRLFKVLNDYNDSIDKLTVSLDDHEEYTESWAHEIKTPIALLTMLLDNHGSGFTPDLKYKMEYIRCRLSDSVEQMLQYARIKSSHKDYNFETLLLRDIINEAVADYEPLLSEKDFVVINKVKDETVRADRRALQYMIGQFVSNSIKYVKEDPELVFSFEGNVLSVRDNGIGVNSSDLPFVFEKGFTGNTGELRSKATGMGLYLAYRIAEDNKIGIEAKSPEEGGFLIELTFPEIWG